MIIPYTELPADVGGTPRPLLDVVVADMHDARVPCLVDSGAVNTLLPRWTADVAGVDLRDARERDVVVAGEPTVARFVTTRLAAGGLTWGAPVAFCHPWTHSWGLLGHDAFFRFFTVTFRAADLEFDVAPIAR